MDDETTTAPIDNPPLSAPAPPAPPAPPVGDPPKKKRGRPKGSTNKPKENVPDDDGKSPFADSPPGDAKSKPKKPNGKTARRNILALLPADKLAPEIVGGAEAGLVMLASLRYGGDAAKAALALSDNERVIFSVLLEEVIREWALDLSPGEAIALVLAFSYAPRFAALEYVRAKNIQDTKAATAKDVTPEQKQ